MRRLSFALASAAMLAAFAGAAYAGGSKKMDTSHHYEPRSNWSGFYIGAGVGAGAVVHDLNISAFGGSIDFDGIGGEGAFGTLVAGYDHQMSSHFVVGIFGEYSFSDISTDLNITGLGSISLKQDSTWSIGGRAGFLTNPGTLVYGTVGYSHTEFDDLSFTGLGSLSIPSFSGWFVGGGIETKLTSNLSLRAEYRFTQYDSESVFSIPGLIDVSLEPSVHTGQVVLSYKFNFDHGRMAQPMK